jgi:hypothetical protein
MTSTNVLNVHSHEIQRGQVWLLWSEHTGGAEIERRLRTAHGDQSMSLTAIRYWMKKFGDGVQEVFYSDLTQALR